jgi:ribosome biogenesis GTPase A
MAFIRARGKKPTGGMGKIRSQIKFSDVVLEIIDCRDARSTRNLQMESWIGQKLLIIGNKADLATPVQLERFTAKGWLAINAKDQNGGRTRAQILSAILSKSDVRPLRISIVGFPNVGKSTVANLLLGRHLARTGPIAGTTVKKEYFKVSDDIQLVDWPGVFPAKMNAVWLASRGAINVDGLDDPDYYFAKIYEKEMHNDIFLDWLSKKFGISVSPGAPYEEVLSVVARRRKLVLPGDEPNTHEAAKIILRAIREAPI